MQKLINLLDGKKLSFASNYVLSRLSEGEVQATHIGTTFFLKSRLGETDPSILRFNCLKFQGKFCSATLRYQVFFNKLDELKCSNAISFQHINLLMFKRVFFRSKLQTRKMIANIIDRFSISRSNTNKKPVYPVFRVTNPGTSLVDYGY